MTEDPSVTLSLQDLRRLHWLSKEVALHATKATEALQKRNYGDAELYSAGCKSIAMQIEGILLTLADRMGEPK